MVTGSSVSLAFECENLPQMDYLSKSDPFIVVLMKDGSGDWKEIGRTEIVVNSESPVFVKKVVLVYKFESIQHLRFVVYDADEDADVNTIVLAQQDLIGDAETVLSDIVHKKSATKLPLKLNDKDRGSITVKCEELCSNNGVVKGEIAGVNMPKSCFLKIFNEDEKNGLTAVYKSEVSNGNWRAFEITANMFCNGDLNRPILIQVFKYKANGSHVLQGQIKSSVIKLAAAANTDLPLTNGPCPGSLSIRSFAFIPKPTFLQYVQNGLDLNFMVAIDFTASNGNPTSPTSLHYANAALYAQGQFNSYEKAIMMVGGVLEFYDTDRFFPTYGFGACLDASRTASHCFALNRNEEHPELYGVSGILEAYHNALSTTRFSGPTLFEEVLNKALGLAMQIQAEKNKYLVLMIITDGVIHDMDETIKLIVRGADLLLSIIIVGVGNEDFTKMEILDGDEHRLEYDGKKASRDIVQFVALNEMENQSPEAIAKAVLEEIPTQVTEYMEKNGITVETVAALRPYEVTPVKM
ncbi:hypothetical protein BLSTO_03306 [Blastocystis sp. subtype 1]